MNKDYSDLSGLSMLDLFRAEVEGQLPILNNSLVELEKDPRSPQLLESLMRSAHSLKGAARIVNIGAAVDTAHAMEDCFAAAQKGGMVFNAGAIDIMLRGVDLLARIAGAAEAELAFWDGAGREEIGRFVAECGKPITDASAAPSARPPDAAESQLAENLNLSAATRPEKTQAPGTVETGDSVLRVTAENLTRLLGFAGESLVASRWLPPFVRSLARLKQTHIETERLLERASNLAAEFAPDNRLKEVIAQVRAKVAHTREFLAARLVDLDQFDRMTANLSHRIYGEALSCRMRPLADCAKIFPRMVRDLSRALGKEARLEIVGETTEVDRDILEKLEAPLNHLLRNALDHGIEPPEERRLLGKNPCGAIRIEAEHRAGMLIISVYDDGRGIDLEMVRSRIIARGLANGETAGKLRESELLEFLFLPGFSMRDRVTELSGRGVGLDVVQNLIREARGSSRIFSRAGCYTKVHLTLPLSLSVLRSLIVEIAGEAYAIPLARIRRVLKMPVNKVESTEGRQHFLFNNEHIGLVVAAQVLEIEDAAIPSGEIPVVLLEGNGRCYGVAVDRFCAERELVVHPLDPRLGKVPNISAASLQLDGSPLLIIDVDDFMQTIENLVTTGRMRSVRAGETDEKSRIAKKVLVVDDSLTVRELQRKLLESNGYAVDAAVDGMDGWNAVRLGQYNLIVTDIDMPRMDGIELTTMVKKDIRLHNLPVMVVSYKDREEDRLRGLAAGADYYLTKASFHDETYISSVKDLIGEPYS
ncbi:MAG: hybrid sensor histidine kinase/response regulator [bacterium]